MFQIRLCLLRKKTEIISRHDHCSMHHMLAGGPWTGVETRGGRLCFHLEGAQETARAPLLFRWASYSDLLGLHGLNEEFPARPEAAIVVGSQISDEEIFPAMAQVVH